MGGLGASPVDGVQVPMGTESYGSPAGRSAHNLDGAQPQGRQPRHLADLQTQEPEGLGCSGMSPSQQLATSSQGLQPEQLAELYQNCLRLATENKITAANSWSLSLIEHLSDLVAPAQVGCATTAAGPCME